MKKIKEMWKISEVLCCLFVCVGVFLNVTESAIVHGNDVNPSNRGIDAKGILSSLAANFLSRGYYPTATAGSQVVSLNLTNLLVLVLLKALIFAAGSIGLGHLKEKEYDGYYGRSINEKNQDQNQNLVITEDEIMLYLEYLTGNHECLKNIACQQPDQAEDYANAGKLLLKASQLFSVNSDKYEDLLREVEDAVELGRNKGNCGVFVCNSND